MVKNYLINGPISPNMISAILAQLREKTDIGGHSIFLGQVRSDILAGKRVTAIDYSAYEALVKSEADKIKADIFSEFADVKLIEIIHSEGIVKAGEISLFVLVSAGHRDHATLACRKTVEMIKEKLPVWKKEIFEDNTYQWQHNQ
jgi:molybdopterin synthase catalytic subunit